MSANDNVRRFKRALTNTAGFKPYGHPQKDYSNKRMRLIEDAVHSVRATSNDSPRRQRLPAHSDDAREAKKSKLKATIIARFAEIRRKQAEETDIHVRLMEKQFGKEKAELERAFQERLERERSAATKEFGQQNSALKSLVVSLRENNSLLTGQNVLLRADVNRLNEEKLDLTKRHARDLGHMRKKAAADRQTLVDEKAALTDKNALLLKVALSLRNERNQLRSEAENLANVKQRLTEDNAMLEDEVTRFRTSVEEPTSSFEQLRKALEDQHEEECRRHQEENARLSQEVSSLSARLEEAENLREQDCKSQLEQKESFDLRLKTLAEQHVDESRRLKEEAANRSLEVSSLRTRLEEAEQRCERLRAEYELARASLNEQNRVAKERLAALEDQYNDETRAYKQEEERLKFETLSLKARLDKANRRFDEHQLESEQARKTLEEQKEALESRLKAKQPATRGQNVGDRSFQDEIASLTGEISSLYARLDESEKECKALRDEREQAKRDAGSLLAERQRELEAQELMKHKLAKIGQFEKKIVDLNKEADDLRKQNSAAFANSQRLEEESKRMHRSASK